MEIVQQISTGGTYESNFGYREGSSHPAANAKGKGMVQVLVFLGTLVAGVIGYFKWGG